MNRTDRLQAILIHLQSKSVVTAQEIADRFGICLRTVYRDIRALEEAGIPIGADAGIGYYLSDNYRLAPATLTTGEAASLVFAEKLMSQMTDQGMQNDYRSALYKIKSVLSTDNKATLETLDDKVTVIESNPATGDVTLFMCELRKALTERTIVEITYHARFDAEPTTRLVEPIGLCNYFSRWHMFAWCHLRREYRDFRLDRIGKLRLTDRPFTKQNHISTEDYLKTILPNGDDVNIVIEVEKRHAKAWFGDGKKYYGLVFEENRGESIRCGFVNNELTGFAAWLLNCGCMARVERPDELRQKIREMIMETCSGYAYLLGDDSSHNPA